MLSRNFAEMTTSTPFRDLLHAANLRHGTDGFASPPKEGVMRIYHMVYYKKNVNQSTHTFLPINTSRIISNNQHQYHNNDIVTTYNYNTVDNIYAKKHANVWDPRMSTVTLQTNIVLA